MITPETVELIKSRIDIIDIVGEYVKLKKRGTNYLGNCPFHNEKTPSFTVSPSKELYKCFGCGKSGNAITFLREHDKLSYVEALKWIANRYNIPVEETEASPEQKQQQLTADSLYIINSFSNQFFSQQLWDTEEGQAIALSYLTTRGFNHETIQKFQLGYSPNQKDALVTALLDNQFSRELLPKTGLVATRGNNELVDNYRGRIVFPIQNVTGKTIGFGARVIGKADKTVPKYINTPENEVYVKSKTLYGIYFARQAIDKANECLLVEGYTDVVSLHQAGVENVVASGGTSLTVEQLRLIKKYTNNLTIVYDGDAAGVKAALRGLDMAVEEGMNVKLVLIPDNEDPDSYVYKVGTTAFKEFVATQKKDFILFQLDIMMKEAEGDIQKKNAVVNQIAETLSKINRTEDFTKQQEYIKQCAALLKIDEGGLTNLVNKHKRDKIVKEEKKLPFAEAEFIRQQATQTEAAKEDLHLFEHQDEAIERNMLRALVEHGFKPWDETQTNAAYIFDALEQFQFEIPVLQNLYKTYQQLYATGATPDAKSFLYHEDQTIRDLIIELTAQKHELSQRWNEKIPGILNRDATHEDVLMSINYFKLHKIKKMIQENQNDMEKAPYDEQLKIIQIHQHLKDIEREITKELGTVIFR